MKVSFITASWLPKDGFGSFLSSFVHFFEERGDMVTVYHEDNTCQDLASGRVVATHLSSFLDVAMKISSDAPHQFDFLFDSDCVFISYLPYYPLMEIARFLPEQKVVFLYPGITPWQLYPDYDPLKSFTKDALSHLGLLKAGDGVIVNSSYMADELLELATVQRESIHVVPLPCPFPLNSFTQADNTMSQVGHCTCKMLYVGRISGNKRVDFLLSGLRELLDNSVDCSLTIAGVHDRLFSREYLQELEDIIFEHGLNDRVTFENNLSQRELIRLYQNADLFVTGSVHEGFCLPVAEALTCGLPCLVPDVTATAETMGTGGDVYKALDVKDFAAGVTVFANDRAYRAEKSKRAIDESARFTFDVFSQKLEQVLSILLNSDRVPGNKGEGERFYRIDLAEAVSVSAYAYEDSFSLPIAGPVVKWFRRKMTLPVEKTVVRPMVRQQNMWNKLVIEEINDLRAQIAELKKNRT